MTLVTIKYYIQRGNPWKMQRAPEMAWLMVIAMTMDVFPHHLVY